MHLNRTWNKVLNSGQTTLDVSDQPVCSLTKEFLFRHQEIFLSVFSHLQVILYWVVFLGNWWQFNDRGFRACENSYWKEILHDRTWYTLEITLCAIFIKLCEATSVSEADLLSYDWLTEKPKDNTSFLFWECVTDLQIKVLMYIRSICEANLKCMLKFCQNY